jgi:hypothetical protein
VLDASIQPWCPLRCTLDVLYISLSNFKRMLPQCILHTSHSKEAVLGFLLSSVLPIDLQVPVCHRVTDDVAESPGSPEQRIGSPAMDSRMAHNTLFRK